MLFSGPHRNQTIPSGDSCPAGANNCIVTGSGIQGLEEDDFESGIGILLPSKCSGFLFPLASAKMANDKELWELENKPSGGN